MEHMLKDLGAAVLAPPPPKKKERKKKRGNVTEKGKTLPQVF